MHTVKFATMVVLRTEGSEMAEKKRLFQSSRSSRRAKTYYVMRTYIWKREYMEEMISVVIPTLNRPILVKRAIASALTQTYKNIEVIVVVDGPDEVTLRALDDVYGPRVRILPLPENVGGSDARNAGVREARGKWIAFLDDDDEWFPHKLSEQMKAACDADSPFPIIACVADIITPRGRYQWPRRFPKPGQPISEYLFVRNSVFQGEGFLPTPTLLVKRELMQLVPFSSGLKKHQDWDWILRVAQLDAVSFKIVPEPLVKIYFEEARISVSSTNRWKFSLEWLRANRSLFTPKAYSCFIASQIVPPAANGSEWKAFVPLLLEMYRFGKMRAFDLFLFLGFWLAPQTVRRKIRAVCMG